MQTLLRDRIATGGWAPGEMLPNEYELAAEYRVSQGTARKALAGLEAERLIVRRQGRGTFVAQHTPQRALFHFFRMVGPADERLKPLSTVLGQRRTTATRHQAALLDVQPGAALHAVKRVRAFDERPAIVERLFVPASAMPDLLVPRGIQHDEEMYVIYQQRFGVTIARATERLAASPAGAGDARLLALRPGTPLLTIERVAKDVAGRPVELRLSLVNTARCRYAAEVL